MEFAEAVPIVLEGVSLRQEQSTVQFLYNKKHVFGVTGMDYVVSGPFHKGTILQQNYRKMTIHDNFFYNSSVKLHGKKLRRHNMTML